MSTHKANLGEFELIAKYFAGLASKGAPAFGLTDDAAVLSPPSGKDLVFTKDTLVAGVHFFDADDAKTIARKVARVNLSDLAGMGAKPYGYLLSLALPNTMNDPYKREMWIKSFTEGLQMEQDEFGWQLYGGDTVVTKGPLTISITAIGLVDQGTALHRFTAKEDDFIYVSGSLGDSAFGLMAMQGLLEVGSAQERDYLIDRYHVPRPRIDLGLALVGVANAAMDISDGLSSDLGHLCKASNLGAQIFDYDLPISGAVGNILERNELYKSRLWNGGDDYELLFTVSEKNSAKLGAIGKELNIPITKIGHMTKVKSISLLDNNWKKIPFEQNGYRHF